MLGRIQGVRQDDANRRRHWFQDDFFDLFVWTGGAGEVLAFQLCYDRLREERVLAWSEERGFLHRRIDDGEDTPQKNRAPIMVADGDFAAADVAAQFEARGAGVDAALREFVLRKIREAGGRPGA
jgi:hypothetical protein